MDQNQQQGTAFVPGLRLFRPDNAPQFVLGKLVITIDELMQFIQQNPQSIQMYNGQRQIKVDLLWSKAGKPYCKLDTYQANGGQQGGAPQAPAAPGYPPQQQYQQPQQAPAGYPPAQPQAPQYPTAAPQAPQYPTAAPAQPQAPQYPPVQQPYGPQQPQQPGQFQAPSGDLPF